MTSRKEQRRKKKRWLKRVALIVALFVIGVGTYAGYLYMNAKKTVNDKVHQPIVSLDHHLGKNKINATKTLNFLLLGIDTQAGDQGRSDAVIILSLHPKTDTLKMISIPRDTRVPIVGKGRDDKINHAYAFGGVDMAINTVENFLNVELDYYVRMNMSGLEEFVDQLGGITVENEIEWSDETYHFPKGRLVLDGRKTMSYVRMRKNDPEGDLGRTTRQRQVIEAIIDLGTSVGSINKMGGMINILGNNMATNLDFDDMKNLIIRYANTRKNRESYQIEGKGTTINGTYYLIVTDDEIRKVRMMLGGYY